MNRVRLVPSARVACAIATLATVLPQSALGQTAAPAAVTVEQQKAAQFYDEAVTLFDAAKFAEAARAFLRADELAPSSQALESAIASARRANDHLLVAMAARRAIDREQQAPKLAAEARIALSEAEPHLASVRLSCEPEPCALSVDGNNVLAGAHYLLPGTHLFRASGPSGTTEQRLMLGTGAKHELVLEISSTPKRAPAPVGTPRITHADEIRDAPVRKPLEPWVFFTGIGVTGALAIASTWSGVDALGAADDYRGNALRTAAERKDVEAAVRRTDFLLFGTALTGALTTYVGLWLVDWDSKTRSLRASPMLDHPGVLISGALE